MSKEVKSSASVELRGKILTFNINPKGRIEGVLVETTAGPVQINFPKHAAEILARSMEVGAQVYLIGELETKEGDHPVYTACGEEAEAKGTIVRLNYSLHGEVNGCHLDEGTFLYVKPEAKKKWKLRMGDKVKAKGSRRAGQDAVVLEVATMEQFG